MAVGNIVDMTASRAIYLAAGPVQWTNDTAGPGEGLQMLNAYLSRKGFKHLELAVILLKFHCSFPQQYNCLVARLAVTSVFFPCVGRETLSGFLLRAPGESTVATKIMTTAKKRYQTAEFYRLRIN